ncbi:hypothetical protein DFP72DRAFT_1169555 [Ephemerocybe angulata]|uniref:Uncharacterized protein n=1 Tax=Ephemerocybe angulata TaxID=980116 RepID=A0A8H6M889_9AGAR|nr:hypothetical protein DFP72DRAFT_1169555 [Tulosesus angulatus]
METYFRVSYPGPHLDTPGQSLDLPGVLPGTWNIQLPHYDNAAKALHPNAIVFPASPNHNIREARYLEADVRALEDLNEDAVKVLCRVLENIRSDRGSEAFSNGQKGNRKKFHGSSLDRSLDKAHLENPGVVQVSPGFFQGGSLDKKFIVTLLQHHRELDKSTSCLESWEAKSLSSCDDALTSPGGKLTPSVSQVDH